MAWIYLAAGAQFINAVVAILDKYIVTDERALPRPFVYAFYSCLVTGFWVVVYLVGFVPGLESLGAPQFSNVQAPSIQVVGMSFLAAYTFFMALVSMYDSLKSDNPANVMPVIGAVSAVATFGMSYLFLKSEITHDFVWGISLLAIGTFLVSQTHFRFKTILSVFHSGIFFALHFIAMKGLFLETSFDDGFFWSRISFVLFALSLLLVPAYYEKITAQTKTTSAKAGMLVLATKILAGVAAFMLLKATDWGDVAVVQATDGLKFVFILGLTLLFGSHLPDTCVECETRPREIVRKILYVTIIVIGFFLLFDVDLLDIVPIFISNISA